ncbi:hypothetical protein ZOSMA_30G00980 [Zostera marina]|uniref:Uncharacterized protein n=1 Tax=Zostera marina TaxID=29655 RepID=A0A0K9P9R4_ZOSMR|nr:hypothetical protein ZOSMA_30G00980 [Zostera marina]
MTPLHLPSHRGILAGHAELQSHRGTYIVELIRRSRGSHLRNPSQNTCRSSRLQFRANCNHSAELQSNEGYCFSSSLLFIIYFSMDLVSVPSMDLFGESLDIISSATCNSDYSIRETITLFGHKIARQFHIHCCPYLVKICLRFHRSGNTFK